MSPVQITVDDTSSSISYSGSWRPITHSGANDNSLHQSTTAGSTLTLSYTGSPAITIFGSIEPCDNDLGPPTYDITMDGKTGERMTVVCNGQFQNGLSVTAEADGPTGVNAPHVMTLTNLGGSQNAPLMFDFIQYDSYPGGSSTSAAQAPPPPTTTGLPPASSSSPISSTSPTSTTATASLTGSKASLSSKIGFPVLSAFTITQLTTINGVATSVAIVTTSTNLAGGSISSSPSITGGASGNRSHIIGPIIGGIVGILAILALLLWLVRRHKRISGLTDRDPEVVEPFYLIPNSPPELAASSANGQSNSTSNISQPSSIAPRPSTSQVSETSRGGTTHVFDEKAGPRPPFQAKSQPFQMEELASELQSSIASPSSPPVQCSPRPPSTIALSDVAPAYVRTPHTSRAHYRSGLSTLALSLDVPPSYDSVGNVSSVPPSHSFDPRDSIQESV